MGEKVDAHGEAEEKSGKIGSAGGSDRTGNGGIGGV
jgi:hypothetical protein